MLLPLPAGVKPEEVVDGRVVLHVQVAPRVLPTPSATVMHSTLEASVDSDRRVRCRVRAFDLAMSPPGITERSGAVDFLVLAAVAATNGGG
jgi:hypothetical protein